MKTFPTRGVKLLLFGATLWSIVAVAIPSLRADPIYSWKDARGNTHFSSTPPNSQATPLALPTISRGDSKIAPSIPRTCERHGGSNCDRGPDIDGSVICSDGHRGSFERYQTKCVEAKLEILSMTRSAATNSITVLVRNQRPVKAHGVTVKMKLDNALIPLAKRRQILQGLVSVDAFGTGDYLLQLSKDDFESLKPTEKNFEVTCENCP